MEGNRDESYRCIDLTMQYIKKKDLDNAWKFSVKANKLYPSSQSKRLMKKIEASLKKDKRRAKKRRKIVPDNSDSSYNGDNSNSSSNERSTKQSAKKSKQSHISSSTAYSFEKFKEMNKDESMKCFEKAEQFLKDEQFELALKFLLKSNKLFTLPKSDELLKKIQETKETSKPKVTYTEEQENIVKKVKNSENYYTMLGVNINATIPEIKKAFKKLALLLHPDKNSAPGSGEVFVDLSNAVNTLCDNTKRITYDQKLKKPTPTFGYYSQSSYRQQPTNLSNTSRRRNSNYTLFEDHTGCFRRAGHPYFFTSYNYPQNNDEEYYSAEEIFNDYYYDYSFN